MRKMEYRKPAARMRAVAAAALCLMLVLPWYPGDVQARSPAGEGVPLPYQRQDEQPLPVEPDPLVQAMIAEVNPDDLYRLVGDLSGAWPVAIGADSYTFHSRFTGDETAITNATRYAFDYFDDLDLTVAYHPYQTSEWGARRNVIAEQRGETRPQEIYLLTAHLDSTAHPFSGPASAPGADDNASGSAAVMLAASILSRYDFACTVRYALFTGEEQGLWGSYAYARDLSSVRENVAGVLNLDMIAFNTPSTPHTLSLYTRGQEAGDLHIASLFSTTVDLYDLPLQPRILQTGMKASDHASFWEYGYPAALAIEDWDDHTPKYHTSDDRLETLDLDYYTSFVRASVGTLAHLGCLMEGELAGQVRASSGQALEGAQIEASRAPGQSWSASSGVDGGYTLAVPPGSYTVTVSLPGFHPIVQSGVQVDDRQVVPLDFSLRAAPRIQASPAAIELWLAGSASQVETVRIANSGGEELAWQASEEPPAAWLQIQPMAGLVPPGGDSSLEALFLAPSSGGVYTTTIGLASNDPYLPELSLPVTLRVPCQPVSGLDIVFDPENPYYAQPVTFQARFQAGHQPITFSWDLGNGRRLHGPGLDTIQHTYPFVSKPNTYTVRVMASNGCSPDQVHTETITVEPRRTYFPVLFYRSEQPAGSHLPIAR